MSDLVCAFCGDAAALIINGHSACLQCKGHAVNVANNGFLAGIDYKHKREETSNGK